MYQVDNKDRVIPLENAPQSSIGAPCPLVVADEHRVALAYYLQNRDPGWDGTKIRIIDPRTSSEPVALVLFRRCCAYMFGPPNDEAFSGHPLADRGLRPYAAFRIEESSWLRRLERMNSVHPNHKPERFWELQHLVFAFHDSTFECICEDFEVVRREGALVSLVKEMADLLRG